MPQFRRTDKDDAPLLNRRDFVKLSAAAGASLAAPGALAQRVRRRRDPAVVRETDEFVLWWVQSGLFLNNTYLVVDRESGGAALVDPYFDSVEQWRPILDGLSGALEAILVTHTHIDHVWGLGSFQAAYPKVKIYLHEDGLPLIKGRDIPTLTGGLESLEEYAERFRAPVYEPVTPTDELRDGEPFSIGDTRFEVFLTPGHCPGHVAFLNGNTLISGDILYKGSVGFTNIPGSDPEVLAKTLIEKFLPLGDDVTVYAGHGRITAIGDERKSNTFILDALTKRE